MKSALPPEVAKLDTALFDSFTNAPRQTADRYWQPRSARTRRRPASCNAYTVDHRKNTGLGDTKRTIHASLCQKGTDIRMRQRALDGRLVGMIRRDSIMWCCVSLKKISSHSKILTL